MVTEGREGFKQEPETHMFKPRRRTYDSMIIDGHSGYISLQAFHWLSRNNVPVYILNFDGSMVTSILPPTPVKADIKTAQIRASMDEEMRFKIAYSLIEAKMKRSLDVLKWIGQRYDISRETDLAEKEAETISAAGTVDQIRTVEGRTALRYWQAYSSVIPECFEFEGRMTKSHQNNAVDPINLALNYAYGVLEGECRKAINTVGLEPSVGFLHETSDYQTKQSLVYDLQEPFRWIADVTVLEAIESRALDLKDFYFMADDYRYRIEAGAKRRFLTLLKERFNAGTKYRRNVYKWDTMIQMKTQEMARFLAGKSKNLSFLEPALLLEREDNSEAREKILALTWDEARTLGIGKSTLHYLRKHAKSDEPFKVYQRVAQKLSSAGF